MQIEFEEFEFYGQVLHISKTCLKCKNDCKVKSCCKNAEIICINYKSYTN